MEERASLVDQAGLEPATLNLFPMGLDAPTLS